MLRSRATLSQITKIAVFPYLRVVGVVIIIRPRRAGVVGELSREGAMIDGPSQRRLDCTAFAVGLCEVRVNEALSIPRHNTRDVHVIP